MYNILNENIRMSSEGNDDIYHNSNKSYRDNFNYLK